MIYIDANIDGGLARYITHSCDRNCKLIQRWRMCFFAKRDIKKGAELSFNYEWTKEMGKGHTKCLCGK